MSFLLVFQGADPGFLFPVVVVVADVVVEDWLCCCCCCLDHREPIVTFSCWRMVRRRVQVVRYPQYLYCCWHRSFPNASSSCVPEQQQRYSYVVGTSSAHPSIRARTPHRGRNRGSSLRTCFSILSAWCCLLCYCTMFSCEHGLL